VKELRKMTRNKLIQLVDANDVNPDGSLDYTPPLTGPMTGPLGSVSFLQVV